MNREILFRGKIDTDAYSYGRKSEWVYGYYTKYSCIFSGRSAIEQEKDDYAVLDETVCQYTGLTDKNGIKIFEGDIITFEDICCEGIPGYECPDEWALDVMNKAEIIIHEGCVCFGRTLFQTSVYEDIQLHYPNIQKWFTECAKVIGNIYDNPELLSREG